MFASKVAKSQPKDSGNSNDRLAPRRSTPAPIRGGAVVEQAQRFQQTIGNQATLRLLSHHARNLAHNEPHEHGKQGSDQTAQAFSRVPAATPLLSGSLQPKLTIGAVDDPLEREADTVAEHVMRMPDPEIGTSASSLRISRKCAECQEDEASKLQPKANTGAQSPGSEAPASVHETLESHGEPLDPKAREFFEPRFGRDFSAVRVHADTRAKASAQGILARAYTVGSQIVFGAGQYNSASEDGRRLLAHELTHSAQQGAAGGPFSSAQRTLRPCRVGNHVQREVLDAGPPSPAAPATARDLTEEDEKSCSPLLLQKLCVYIDGGFNGDRSGVASDEEMKNYNAACRNESGYPGSEPDVQINNTEKAMLGSTKCKRGDPEAARKKAHADHLATILDRSAKYILGGAGEEIVNMIKDPIFETSVGVAITAYVGAWFLPEPVFSKIAAVLATVALLSTGLFSLSVIKNVAQAWMDADSDADSAQTPEQIEDAAKRFGGRIGAVDADCLVFMASLLVGGKIPGPKGAPAAGEALAEAKSAIAAPKPDGNVIQGPWGKAGFKPSAGGSPGTPVAFDGTSPLKVEFFPEPEPAAPPEPSPPPAAANAPARPAGVVKPPVVPLVPGVGKNQQEQSPESNSMRHQIQRGDDDHFASLAVFADAKVGVTALQLRTTMAQNFDQFMRIARQDQAVPQGWVRGSVKWESAIRSAIIKQSEQITDIVASGGVIQGGDINSFRQCFDTDTLSPTNCKSDDVRLDIENKGRNLKS